MAWMALHSSRIAAPAMPLNDAWNGSAKPQRNWDPRRRNWRPDRRGRRYGAFGNALRHAYDQIDPARIWEIVTRDLPDLLGTAEKVLERLDPD
jgi:ribonuclease HepT-like protein